MLINPAEKPIGKRPYTPALASTRLANEIIVNEKAISADGGDRYLLTYTTAWGDTCEISISFNRSFPKQRVLPYAPLSLNDPSIQLSYLNFNGAEIKHQIACVPWLFEIESSECNRIAGWMLTPSQSFIVRPFIVNIDHKPASFFCRIGGTREDVNRAFNSFSMHAVSLEINHSVCSSKQDISISVAYDYYCQNKTSQPKPFYQKTLQNHTWRETFQIADILSAHTASLSNRDNGPHKVAVLMPIYDGYTETIEALKSLFPYYSRYRKDLQIRFILGLDNPCNLRLNNEVVNRYGQHSLFTIIINEHNLGFIGNCNRLFSHVRPGEDILLLNSDIIAPSSNWIERLIRTAEEHPRIGTVTPFSNQASIFSFPTPNVEQGLFQGLTIDEIDDLINLSSCNTLNELVPVPSCHGFCTLIKTSRFQLELLFDPVFGRGYGEENDLSMRILEKGFFNVACPKTYVYHHESVSFSKDKQNLIAKNLKLLGERHPSYHYGVLLYCREDPLRLIRNKVILSHWTNNIHGKNGIVHISHFRGGGTNKYVANYIASAPQKNHFAVRPCKRFQGYLEIFHVNKELSLSGQQDFIMLTEYEFLHEAHKLAKKLQVEQIIYHSLIDFCPFGSNIMPNLQNLGKQVDITAIFHDYHWISESENLLDKDNIYKGPHISRTLYDINIICRSELLYGMGPYMAYGKDEYINRFAAIFKNATFLIAPSESAKIIASSALKGHSMGSEIQVVYHDKSGEKMFNYYQVDSIKTPIDRINVGIIGAIGPNKGLDSLVDLARYIDMHSLPIALYVIGWTSNDELINSFACTSITGKYDETHFPELVESLGLVCSLFLSQWPETYSYTLSLSFDVHLWPFVLNIGAQAERVLKSGYGTVLIESSSEYIANRIITHFSMLHENAAQPVHF